MAHLSEGSRAARPVWPTTRRPGVWPPFGPVRHQLLGTMYDDVAVHRVLVGDAVRTRAFRQSIAATVRRGDVVLDVGAGSGILSLFAAQAGAARVYAIERAPGAAAIARQLVALNGLQRQIILIQADAAHAVLPEQVDVLVSEWLGAYGVDENMLPSVVTARDRWLRSDGTTIPGSVTAWVAPAFHPAAQQVAEFHSEPYGLNLAPLAPYPLDEIISLPQGASASALRAEPQPMWVVEPATIPVYQARTAFRAACTFELTADRVNGLLVWFSAVMPGGGMLTNAPGAPPTHWGQFLFPLARAGDAQRGDTFEVSVECVPAGLAGTHHRWMVALNGQGREEHDTRRAPRAAWAPPWHVFEEAAQTHDGGMRS